MTHSARTLVAAFDAAAMAIFAFVVTGGTFGRLGADVVLWGSAIASAVVALVVATDGPAAVAWAAIGYVLYAGLLAVEVPQAILVALAVALMPTVPRPRGSFALGLVIAVVAAFLSRLLVPLLV